MSKKIDLKYFKAPPSELSTCHPSELKKLLGGPSLIKINGRQSPALFVSVLLHGNETTGILAIQKLLKKYQDKEFPRDVLLFIGNVEAAAENRRHLDHQPDWNRIWAEGDTEYHKMANEVVQAVKEVSPFACIDIHNNTGRNPLYGCINDMSDAFLNLASGFSRTLVYFTEPHEVMSMAMSKLAAATTIEAGRPGTNRGVDAVAQYVDDVLHLESLPLANRAKLGASVFHTLARIYLPKDAQVEFGNKLGETDVCFLDELDTLNFSLLKKGTLIGLCRPGFEFSIVDNSGKERGNEFFSYDNGEIRTKVDLIPSMLTKDVEVIFQDCLGYLMEDY